MTDRTIPDPGLTEQAARDALERIGNDCDHPKMRALVQSLRAALASLPPVPEPMEEPTWPGAVVMSYFTDDGIFTRTGGNDSEPWVTEYGTRMAWESINRPRPLSATERAEHGIPATLPDLDDPGLVERVAHLWSKFWGEGWEASTPSTRESYLTWARELLAEVAKAGEQA